MPASRERILVISDISLTSGGTLAEVNTMERMAGREGSLVLLNGQVNARLAAAPGTRERWRVINACAARYLDLRLDGQQLDLLGMDSGRYQKPRRVQRIQLAPGNRADVLVTTAEGTATLRSLPVDRGAPGAMMGSPAGRQNAGPADGVTLTTFAVAGEPEASPAPVPARPASRDLRHAAVSARRELAFAMGMGAGMGNAIMSFTINGRAFDPSRTDTTVEQGAVEEWTLSNSSPMDHPVHLHVWPMQLIEAPGQSPGDEPVWRDVINVPAGSRVKVRVAFDDFSGRTVYHCHILDHEDLGMMGLLEAR